MCRVIRGLPYPFTGTLLPFTNTHVIFNIMAGVGRTVYDTKSACNIKDQRFESLAEDYKLDVKNGRVKT